MSTTSFAEFITKGRIGPLFLGISREATEQALGVPDRWLGKPPCIGPQVLSPRHAAVWFYYGGKVGIGYDVSDKADHIHVDVEPELKEKYPEVFGTWPLPPNATMDQVQAALEAEGIPFEASDPSSDYYGILANGDCFVSWFPASADVDVSGKERPVRVIYKYASPARARQVFLRTTR